MKWVILQTFYQVCTHSGESYSEVWKWMSFWPHLDLQFRYIFCGVRLTHRDTKYWRPGLHWPYCIRYWVESVLPTSFLVSQAVHRGSHPGQCAVYRMPRYTLTLEKHWSLRYCWALQYHVHLYVWSSLLVEVNYHHQEWTRDKQSAWHCAKAWWISHPYKFTWGSGSHHGRSESSVITCT